MANILIVDDLEDNIFLLKMVIENLGHTVFIGRSGDEALTIMRQKQNSIDLLLLDIMMPGLNGLQVATTLKTDPETRHVPIILLTARKGGVEDVVEGLEAGADEYLTKPFREPELAARIASMLRMKHLYDQVAADKRMLDDEIESARRMQLAMLPTTFPYEDRIAISCRYEPAVKVGGDFYEVIDYGDNVAGIIFADVAGHGPKAAMVVAMFKAMLHDTIGKGRPNLKSLLCDLNDRLVAITDEDTYLTLFFGLLDTTTGRLEYFQSLHSRPAMLRASGEMEPLQCMDGMVGLCNTGPAPDDFGVEHLSTIDMADNDQLFLYSDGITEEPNIDDKKEQFGNQRLFDIIKTGGTLRGDELLNRIIDDLRRFNGESPFLDDVTMMILHRLP